MEFTYSDNPSEKMPQEVLVENTPHPGATGNAEGMVTHI